MKKTQKLLFAFTSSEDFIDFIFHLGYQGFLLPKWFRRIFVKSAIHKAWFSGFYGGGLVGVLERHSIVDQQKKATKWPFLSD